MAIPVQVNVAQIQQALKLDRELFIQFFLEDELTFPVPAFHPQILSLMVDQAIGNCVFAIPRDHAKTTLAKLACVYYFIYSDYRFILYVSNTATIAIPAVNDIVAFMKTENFIAVFGEIEWLVQQEGVGFYKFKFQGKLCILRALGAGQQVRGINVDNQRPQLAVVDDIEDNDNIATEPLFRKLKAWFYGPFRKCLDKFHNKIIHLGNMINIQSLLYEHCNSEYWYSRLYGCLLEDGTPLWPDAWSIEKLKQDFAEYQERGLSDVWFAEMMNMPMAIGKGLIRADEITYKPEIMPGDQSMAFMTIDLAISENTWAHETALAVHAFVDNPWIKTQGHWQIAETHAWQGIDPIALFFEMLAIAFRWQIKVIGIEAVAFQASLQTIYPYLCLQQGVQGFEFIPLPAGQRKVQRLAPWAAMLKSGEYALTEGEFPVTQQLLNYDPQKKTNKDDIIDACAHGPYVFQNFWHLLREEFTPGTAKPAVQGSLQICRN